MTEQTQSLDVQQEHQKFIEDLGDWTRSHTCGQLTLDNDGQTVCLMGWVQYRRDHGGLIFVDLRDREGLTQVVFSPDIAPAAHENAHILRSEYVLAIKGVVRPRPEGMTNPNLVTGAIEVVVHEWKLLNTSKTPPFAIEERCDAGENLRLAWRYLDLRRPSMHEPIVLRSKIMQIIRNYFCENHFTEIETPTLIKSTPEGARDYLVPSRVQPGHFYALPQSPQLYKQILMLSGFDRYFQLAHCYRDEDLRADRQPEFTQVDEEMSFVSEDDIMTLNEGLIKRLWKEMLNVDVETPFYRMPWDEAMGRFGSDKPDTRFGLEIQDVTEVFRGTEFKPFAAVLEAGGTIRAINAKGLADKLSRKNIDKLGEVAKTYGAKGQDIVDMNCAAIDQGVRQIRKITVPESWATAQDVPDDSRAAAPEFFQNTVQLIAQRLIDPWIALYDNFTAQEPPCNIILLGQAGELDCRFDLGVFLQGDPKSHGLVPPTVVLVQILC